MITLEQFKELKITVSNALIGNAALEFISENTNLTVNLDDIETVKALPFSAKLFISKYDEVISTSSAVASESIEGLSQSFKTGDKSAMIWDLANSLLSNYLTKGGVRFVAATRRWN